MPRPNSTGPRKNKPQGPRSGSRTREDRSDSKSSFSKRGSEKPARKPSKSAEDQSPRAFKKPAAKPFKSRRSDGDDRRSGTNRGSDFKPGGPGARPFRKKSFSSDRSDFKGSDRGGRGDFKKASGPGSRTPGSKFGAKKPARESGDEVPAPRKFDRDKFADFDHGKKKSFGSRDHGEPSEGGRPFNKKFDRAGLKRGGKNIHLTPEPPQATASGPVRLNKFIANSGVCSRREADELITMGLISVNGKVVTTLGHKVNPGDEVRHENRVLKAEKPVYILLNKPKGFLTTTSDPEERSTVMHLVSNVVKERVYPVGRLDRNTTGLLVLTNDGDLADKLMHPSHNVKKVYRVELDRPLTKADATRIMEGVQLEEGRAMVDDLAIVSEDKKTVGLEIHIGWNRVVRRIFESLDYQVVKLDRSMYAGLTKKDLPRGEWRFLTREEIVLLKHYK